MSITVKGIVLKVGATVQVSEKFAKRELVVEMADGKYPQSIPLEATGDKIALLDVINVGDEVTAEVNLRGRAWSKPGQEAKYFLSLNIYKVERIGAVAARTTPAGEPSDIGDLPF